MTTDFARLRVDTVGSLLRPEKLKLAFEARSRGDISAAELSREADAAIAGVVKRQEALGLPFATDGELRRLTFMESFSGVAGLEAWIDELAAFTTGLHGIVGDAYGVPSGGAVLPARSGAPADEPGTGRRADPSQEVRRPVGSRLRLLNNRPLFEYWHVRELTGLPASVTLLNPDRVVEGFDAQGSREFYADEEEFLADVVRVQRRVVEGLVAEGCRYIHIDGPSYTSYVDDRAVAAMRAKGIDPRAKLERAIEADNAVIAGFPDVTFGIHICRGNRESRWHREGHYDEIAERLFTGLNHQRLLLEYDTERAGSFAPLRFVPEGKVAVLGVISSKVPEQESVEDIERRVEEATGWLPVERLAISPQCGFASVLQGNRLTEDDQWRKLETMLAAAARIWPEGGAR
ncbi:cobalamin-independent methionine synthase II family protein [Amycolatopsis sp. NPDC021455]|uniref:cobalamin-independent methionine synthase II family protein n=1 Tax=Amycolatopsis sp. NPDC021455 TaxID=3154901 RepID=UPI003407A1EF